MLSTKCVKEKGTTSPRKTSIHGAMTTHKVQERERPIIARYSKEKENELAKATTEEEQVSVHTLSNKEIHSRLMQANAYIKGRKVTILIDSGSILSFINDELALELGSKGRKIKAFDTTMANGRVELGEDFYEGINLKIQGMRLNVDLHAFPLATLDVMLALQWLETSGKVVTDFGKGIIEFIYEGRWVQGRS